MSKNASQRRDMLNATATEHNTSLYSYQQIRRTSYDMLDSGVNAYRSLKQLSSQLILQTRHVTDEDVEIEYTCVASPYTCVASPRPTANNIDKRLQTVASMSHIAEPSILLKPYIL